MVTANTSVFVLLGALCMLYSCSCDTLKIAAFNVQVFGKTKMSKTQVVDILVKTISRYDIVLIQEIRDSSGEAIVELMDRVNAANPGSEFSMKLSPRLGRTSSKEQYAYLYRNTSGLSVLQDYVYDDGDENLGNDTFEREPYIVVFQSSKTKLKKIACIGIHVAPDQAVEEMKAFGPVFDDVKRKTDVNDIVLMGDLNADCSYVPNYRWAEIPLKSDSNYKWLISDDVDTTVSNSDCAYDRFIMTGEGFGDTYINGSAKVFLYDTEYGLNQSVALDVSDHYPIWFELEMNKYATGSGIAVVVNVLLLLLTTVLMIFVTNLSC